MSENERELIKIIRESKDPEKAVQIALNIIFKFISENKEAKTSNPA